MQSRVAIKKSASSPLKGGVLVEADVDRVCFKVHVSSETDGSQEYTKGMNHEVRRRVQSSRTKDTKKSEGVLSRLPLLTLLPPAQDFLIQIPL